MSTRDNASRSARETGKLSPTELLILALISHGHAPTLYALQKETLLSAGAVFPALAKLKAKRLLETEPRGPRKRQQFRVSPGVLEKMAAIWKSSADDHIADCDAVLKLCKAAEIIDLSEAVEYAHSAAELRASELRKYTNRDGKIEPPEVDFVSYRSYRDLARFYQLQAEEHVLRAVEAALRTDML
jgi:DNA-binding PadR family transcriptional regulator